MIGRIIWQVNKHQMLSKIHRDTIINEQKKFSQSFEYSLFQTEENEGDTFTPLYILCGIFKIYQWRKSL
jgi:hypothetical protein